MGYARAATFHGVSGDSPMWNPRIAPLSVRPVASHGRGSVPSSYFNKVGLAVELRNRGFASEAQSVIIADKMSRSFGDWSTVTPENLRTFPEEDVLEAITLGRDSVNGMWARAELERRHLLALQKATETVHQEVARLTASSTTLESLTKTLKNLTWALMFLTILAAAVPIGVEIWKARHEQVISPSPVPLQP